MRWLSLTVPNVDRTHSIVKRRYLSQVLPEPIHKSIGITIYLSIYLSIYWPVACWIGYLSQMLPEPIHQSICITIYLSIYLFIYLSIYWPVACWRRYLSQVLPEPGKDASATTGPGSGRIPVTNRFLCSNLKAISYSQIYFYFIFGGYWVY